VAIEEFATRRRDLAGITLTIVGGVDAAVTELLWVL